MANPVKTTNVSPPPPPLPRPNIPASPQQIAAPRVFSKKELKKFVRDGARGGVLMSVLGIGGFMTVKWIQNHNNKPGVTPYTSADEAFIATRAKQFLEAKSDADRKILEDKMVQSLTDAGTNASIKSYHATPEQAKNVRMSLQSTYKVTVEDIDGKRFLYQVPMSSSNQGERNALESEVSLNLKKVHDTVKHPQSASAPRTAKP